ncbi:hypothetical protein ABKV19_012824 [Rosa sericea]
MASSTVAPSAIVLELLNMDNYEEWSLRVKTYLLAEGLWKVVEATGDAPKLEDDVEKFDAWTMQNAKALHVIHISCGSATFPFISDTTSARVAWDMLARKLTLAYFKCTDERSDFPTLVDGGWRVHDENMEIEEEAIDGHNNNNGDIGLHKAVCDGNAKMVEEMVQLMEEKDLEIKDGYGETAFYYALTMPLGNNKIVDCMVRKNKALVSTGFDYLSYKNVIPVTLALWYRNWEVADYLYGLTPPEALMPENGPNGADIIGYCILNKKFDIAWDLIRRYPNLAITKDFTGDCPLNLLAGMPSAFLSGTPMTFYQRWIYHYVQTPEIDEENQMDLIESAMCRHVKLPFWQHIRTHCNAVWSFFQELFTTLLKLLGIFDHIYEIKLVHVRVLQLLKCMSKATICNNFRQLHDSVVQRAIFRAIQHGHIEFVTALVTQNPYADAVNICDKKGRNFFMFAVECRREKVYNLIYDLANESFINSMESSLDNFQNSILHMVGTLSPSTQFNHIRDAALQMQRELQWFKEVENFLSPGLREYVNFADNMTGRELFTKNHKELVKEGEKSMKETATSCTVVGALIITIMFAAAFTVAGGNNQNTGLPMFLDDRLFMVFIVSDALSLFASTTSVMIFLGILTSRYGENDFLTSLPTKMMVGLLTLFFSIATMMVSFSTTLIIMLHDKYSWIIVPIVSLACIPITSFVWMQFPLLKEICVSTYGPGIFRKRRSLSRRHRLKMFYARMKGKVVRAFSLMSKNKV